MPRNASGVFSRIAGVFSGPTSWTNRRDSGDATIYAAEHDQHDQDIAEALTDSISASGLTTPSANLPMGGFRHTDVGNASTRDEYAVVKQIQDGGYIWGGTSTGAANAYDISANMTPTITVATPGMKVRFIAHQTNTGGSTITVGSGAAGIHIRRMQAQGSQLLAGEIQSGQVVEAIYDGTVFRLQNPTILVTQQVVQGSTWIWGGTSGGSSSNYTVTLSPVPTTFPAGSRLWFLANHTNTGITSLNVNGLGAAGVGTGWPTVVDLKAGMIQSGQLVDVVFDGLRFLMMNPNMGPLTWTPTVTGDGSVVNLNGATTRARYSVNPFTRRCNFEFVSVFQATGTTKVTFSLPLAPYSTDTMPTSFSSYISVTTGSIIYPGIAKVSGSNCEVIRESNGVFVAANVIQSVVVNGSYEYA